MELLLDGSAASQQDSGHGALHHDLHNLTWNMYMCLGKMQHLHHVLSLVSWRYERQTCFWKVAFILKWHKKHLSESKPISFSFFSPCSALSQVKRRPLSAVGYKRPISQYAQTAVATATGAPFRYQVGAQLTEKQHDSGQIFVSTYAAVVIQGGWV